MFHRFYGETVKPRIGNNDAVGTVRGTLIAVQFHRTFTSPVNFHAQLRHYGEHYVSHRVTYGITITKLFTTLYDFEL